MLVAESLYPYYSTNTPDVSPMSLQLSLQLSLLLLLGLLKVVASREIIKVSVSTWIVFYDDEHRYMQEDIQD